MSDLQGRTSAVRLVQEPLRCRLPPWRVLAALASEPWPFALTGRWAAGGAIVGAAPLAIAPPSADPFELLEGQPEVEDVDTIAGAVGGGWFGWLGYGLGSRIERLPPQPYRPVPLPPFQLAYYDNVLHMDAAGDWWFEALATPERKDALEARAEAIRRKLACPPVPRVAAGPPPFAMTGANATDHVNAVQRCRERIAAGEIFQANICLRLEAEWSEDVTALFARAAAQLQPAYGATFAAPWGGIASLSPELFLRRHGRVISTGPIKGTARREGAPHAVNEALRALRASDKDAAEHVMIVDLMRNDLGRVCEYGSVEAPAAPTAEPHPGVWHLVSTVRGRLRKDVTDGDLLRATFPPASVTGAPKIQAMHVIAALEATGREVYTGAIGYASPVAGLELSVAIRTFEARDGRLSLGVGGGIVSDSNPQAELEECLIKARPLLKAVGSALRSDDVGHWRPDQAERWLVGRAPLGIHLGLDRMRQLLREIGNPQRSFRSIHVVGTNGKSSTVRMTAAILAQHGWLAGAYLSPHLNSFAQRIEVAGTPIAERDLATSVERVAAAAARVDAGRDPADRVTQFEALTAAAFDALAAQGIDVAVVEAGLGGRLDATNVIESEVQVLTSVALDHTELLGETETAIATEKLAVVRDGATLVLGQRLADEVMRVAEDVARRRAARIIRAAPLPSHRPGVLGAFQERNFAVAEAAAKAFLGALDATAIARAATAVRTPGRLQVVDRAPLTIVDAAHNAHGVAALIEALPRLCEIAGVGPREPFVVVVSILADKDATAMVELLAGHFDAVIVTSNSSPRALAARRLADVVAAAGCPLADVEAEPHRALARARELAGPRGLVVAAGSICLAADLL